MSKDIHKYDDFFRQKLENHESLVPENLFEQLMSDRTMRSQLGDMASAAPESLFNKLMKQREGSDEKPTDAPLRERLLDHASAVPNDAFEEIIVERERRWRMLIWGSAALLALLFISYFVFNKNNFIFDKKENKPFENIDKNKQKPAIENKPIVNNDEIGVKDNFNINKNQLKNTTAASPASTKLINKDKVATQATNAQSTVSNSTNYLTNITAEQQTIIPTISNNSTAAVTEPIHLLNNVQPATENRLPEIGQSVGVENAKSNTESKTNDVSSPSEANNTEGEAFKAKTPTFDFENLAILNVKNIALPSRDLQNPCSGPGDGCPTFGKRSRRGGEKKIYVDIYAAPEYAFRRLTENLPEKTAYLYARDSTEKPWYAFSAGARASFVFENGPTLRTGISYAQINEIAKYDSSGIGRKTVTETYTPRANGGFDTVRTTVIVSGIFRTTAYNRYRSIDIPLQLGFEFPLNDYWSFGINGGVNFNLSAWRKATILDEKLKKQDVSSGFGADNPVFRNTLGFSVFGSIAAYRQITGNLQLVIEPSVRHYLQPITRSDFALRQAYTNAGLILGLRYRF